MDYKKILSDELKRNDFGEDNTYHYGEQSKTFTSIDVKSDCSFLLRNVPTQSSIIDGLQTLIDDNPDNSVMLVPIRPFLQTKLKITSQRLDELINDNDWIQSWIEHIKALQEVKIMELFSAGNMEDSKLKWLIWAILGESVDLATTRASVSISAETILLNVNKYDTDN